MPECHEIYCLLSRRELEVQLTRKYAKHRKPVFCVISTRFTFELTPAQTVNSLSNKIRVTNSPLQQRLDISNTEYSPNYPGRKILSAAKSDYIRPAYQHTWLQEKAKAYRTPKIKKKRKETRTNRSTHSC